MPHRIISEVGTQARWWVSCYIWYSEEGPRRAAAPPSPLLAVPNVILLWGFNVAIKESINIMRRSTSTDPDYRPPNIIASSCTASSTHHAPRLLVTRLLSCCNLLPSSAVVFVLHESMYFYRRFTKTIVIFPSLAVTLNFHPLTS